MPGIVFPEGVFAGDVLDFRRHVLPCLQFVDILRNGNPSPGGVVQQIGVDARRTVAELQEEVFRIRVGHRSTCLVLLDGIQQARIDPPPLRIGQTLPFGCQREQQPHQQYRYSRKVFHRKIMFSNRPIASPATADTGHNHHATGPEETGSTDDWGRLPGSVFPLFVRGLTRSRSTMNSAPFW